MSLVSQLKRISITQARKVTKHLLKKEKKLKNSLIIYGFYRSGTTWLQEMACRSLQAIPAIEPFMPSNIPPGVDISKHKFKSYDFLFNSQNNNWAHKHIDNILNFNYFIYGPCKPFSLFKLLQVYCFSSDIVLKCIRNSNSIVEISEKYSLPIIHIYRNPVQVLHSFKKLEVKNKEKFESQNRFSILNVNILDLFSDEIEMFPFLKNKQILEDYNSSSDYYKKILLLYCFNEKIFEEKIKKSKSLYYQISYRQLKNEPEMFEYILKQLNLTKVSDSLSRKKSGTDWTSNICVEPPLSTTKVKALLEVFQLRKHLELVEKDS